MMPGMTAVAENKSCDSAGVISKPFPLVSQSIICDSFFLLIIGGCIIVDDFSASPDFTYIMK